MGPSTMAVLLLGLTSAPPGAWEAWGRSERAGVARCGKFHGCPSLAARNASIRLGQACVWAGAFPAELPSAHAAACAGERFLSASMVDESAPYCGFTSQLALSWLARLNALTSHCSTVVYTVITGGYDQFKQVPGGPQPDLCLVGLVDNVTAEKQTHAAREIGWQLYRLPTPTPWPNSPARTSHSLRAMAMRMFPRAAHTIYCDGKVVLLKPPAQIVHELRATTSAPYIVIEHPWSLSFMNEFKFAATRIRYQRRGDTQRDVDDVEAQRRVYCEEGACNNQAGMLDATMIIQQREPRAVWPAGRTEPAPHVSIRWLECAWFNEMAIFSHRVQLSFFFAVDALGLRRQVHVVPRRQWENKLFQIARHKYGALVDNASAPVAMGKTAHSRRARRKAAFRTALAAARAAAARGDAPGLSLIHI